MPSLASDKKSYVASMDRERPDRAFANPSAVQLVLPSRMITTKTRRDFLRFVPLLAFLMKEPEEPQDLQTQTAKHNRSPIPDCGGVSLRLE